MSSPDVITCLRRMWRTSSSLPRCQLPKGGHISAAQLWAVFPPICDLLPLKQATAGCERHVDIKATRSGSFSEVAGKYSLPSACLYSEQRQHFSCKQEKKKERRKSTRKLEKNKTKLTCCRCAFIPFCVWLSC